MTEQKQPRRARRVALILVSVLVVLCLGAALTVFITNRTLPTEEARLDHLTALDKARLAEAFHLRQAVGNDAWPGWGDVDIPLIVYNSEYAFLVGMADPLPGWTTVPRHTRQGNPWEPVPDDDFLGATYYRSRLPETGETPQAFTLLLGDQWAAAFQTRPAMLVTLAHQFRDDLPPGLNQVFPYSLAASLFLRNSDTYIGGLLHESFHAFEGMRAEERLNAGERIAGQQEDAYPHAEESHVAAWDVELNLLADAVEAEDTPIAGELVREFLAQRAARRAAAELAPPLVSYEQQREWVEGLALYNELQIQRLAAGTAGYAPVPAMAEDGDFDAYRNVDTRWQQEVDQIRRMESNDGDGRFYYSGMAQAALLDRLMPGWKDKIFNEGVYLEDLLATAIAD